MQVRVSLTTGAGRALLLEFDNRTLHIGVYLLGRCLYVRSECNAQVCMGRLWTFDVDFVSNRFGREEFGFTSLN